MHVSVLPTPSASLISRLNEHSHDLNAGGELFMVVTFMAATCAAGSEILLTLRAGISRRSLSSTTCRRNAEGACLRRCATIR